MQICIWRLAGQHPFQIHHGGISQLLVAGAQVDRPPNFQVALPVQIRGFDKAHPGFRATAVLEEPISQ